MTTGSLGTKTKRGLVSRMGNWLQALVQKEQKADPQWDEEERRERGGKAGENIEGDRQGEGPVNGPARGR